MSLDKSTVKPGLLVSLKTVLNGNVKHVKTIIEDDHPTGDGGLEARWETLKSVADAAEHEQAVKVRGQCRGTILSVCSRSNFGLLCPVDKQDQLEAAVAEARRLADSFNAKSSLSKVGVYILVGELVASEAEAAKAINYEVRGLIDSMEQGIKRLDVEQIREAANRAKNLGSMLSDDANAKLRDAINVSRKVARAIVKEGEAAIGEIDKATMARLAEARTAFLDLDDTTPVEAPVVEVEAPQVDLSEDDFVVDIPQENLEGLYIEMADGDALSMGVADLAEEKARQDRIKSMVFDDDNLDLEMRPDISALQELAFQQTMEGARVYPELAKRMADKGDPVAIEVLKRLEAEKKEIEFEDEEGNLKRKTVEVPISDFFPEIDLD